MNPLIIPAMSLILPLLLLHSHDTTICIHIHVETINNNDKWTHFFRKIYLSLYSKWLRKGYVWEVSWRLNKDCNILTPSSSVFSSTSFLLYWAAQLGTLRALPSAESWFSLPRTVTTPNQLNFLLHWVISLFDAHLLPVNVASTPNSTCPQSRLYPDIFDRMHLFLDWRLSWRSICYTVLQ